MGSRKKPSVPIFDPRLASLAVLGMCNWVYRGYGHEHYDVETISDEFIKMIDYGAFSS
jgi:hypothetical protein